MMDETVIILRRLFLKILRQASLNSITKGTNVMYGCLSQNDNLGVFQFSSNGFLFIFTLLDFAIQIRMDRYFLLILTILSPTVILFTTSMPLITLAKMLYLPSKCGVGQWVIKNCTPSVSKPAEAMPTVPSEYV